MCIGPEDARMLRFGDEIILSYTQIASSIRATRSIWMNDCILVGGRGCSQEFFSPTGRRTEKNWSLFVSSSEKLKVLYQLYPWIVGTVEVGNLALEAVQELPSQCLLDHTAHLDPKSPHDLHNGSNGLRVNLCSLFSTSRCSQFVISIIHYATWVGGMRHYYRYVILFDALEPHALIAVSKPISLPFLDEMYFIFTTTIAFMDETSVGDASSKVMISLGLHDTKSAVLVTTVENLVTQLSYCS